LTPSPETISLYLVRHAKAGKRATWNGDDARRPLTAKGLHQAGVLATRLDGVGISRVLSSPAHRCRQTVEPLAARIGITVEDVGALGEGEPVAPAVALLADLADDTVLCAHGDLIPDVLEHLAAVGVPLDGPVACQKASVWTLERRDGQFAVGRYTPPP
jgi:8-oxo-dGTP diphosphatase